MKAAICWRCGEDLGHIVSDDADQITCFQCDNDTTGKRKKIFNKKRKYRRKRKR